MKIIKKVPEEVIVRAFFLAEVCTERHHKTYAAALKKYNLEIDSLEHAEQVDVKLMENVLAEARGWKQNKFLLYGFPDDVQWYEALYEPNDQGKTHYILYDYWSELTNGSLLPQEAVANILANKEIFGTSNDAPNATFKAIAELAKQGETFPPILLVASSKDGPFTILEGHARMTGFALADTFPVNQKYYLGVSKGIEKWVLLDKS